MTEDVNNYYAKNNIDKSIPGFGCHRNPCNLPGYGTTTSSCPKLSVPGTFECTYCKGAGDCCGLKGKGMGCQLTVPTTTANCAVVNGNQVDKTCIWERQADSNCQCCDDYPACKDLISNERDPNTFTKRF